VASLSWQSFSPRALRAIEAIDAVETGGAILPKMERWRCAMRSLVPHRLPATERIEPAPFYLDGGLTAGPLLLPGSPGILEVS
jgi:hypothetical protein